MNRKPVADTGNLGEKRMTSETPLLLPPLRGSPSPGPFFRNPATTKTTSADFLAFNASVTSNRLIWGGCQRKEPNPNLQLPHSRLLPPRRDCHKSSQTSGGYSGSASRIWTCAGPQESPAFQSSVWLYPVAGFIIASDRKKDRRMVFPHQPFELRFLKRASRSPAEALDLVPDLESRL
jgi:hypothetical protein